MQQQPAMTNNPYRQQQSRNQNDVSRGPSNPYVQSAKRNNDGNNNSRPPQQRPQQPMQSAGVGAALLANRAGAGGVGATRSAGTGPAMMAPNNQQQQQQQQQQQNPWTVARANVVTKQNLRYKPGPVPIDEEAVKTWIYPNNTNHPVRDYQLKATETAINYNTLVSLPTGLGKTLIAAATMYNYYRWFPTGKVVFCAPTKPLVSQQLTSCFDIMGVPAEHTAEIMGDTVNKDDRTRYWEERRLFFCTPQTIDNDIDAGRCDVRKIVCVVIDEAHRAKGKYAYVKIIQKINQSDAKFRVVSRSTGMGGVLGTLVLLLSLPLNLLALLLRVPCSFHPCIVCAARTERYTGDESEGHWRSCRQSPHFQDIRQVGRGSGSKEVHS